MRKLLFTIGLLLVAAAIAVGYGLRQFEAFTERPLFSAGSVNLWVAPGSSYAGLIRELERLGIARADWRWRVLGRVHRPLIRAGEYRLDPGISPRRLLALLQAGEVRRHRFVIIEGWTVARLRSELARDSRIRHLSRELNDEELMDRLGCAGCPAEGRFLPETYFFVRGDSDLDLLGRAHRALEERLEQVWGNRRSGLPLDSPDELLVLASIVERETGRASERARVAGVFARRLELGMRLQTDPTVIYGLGDDFDGRIRRVHLQTDHPWNTYVRAGLPPTPIALPGRAALEAAANPEPGTALYFVSRGDGTHHFSDTLAEHNAAVDRYIRGRN